MHNSASHAVNHYKMEQSAPVKLVSNNLSKSINSRAEQLSLVFKLNNKLDSNIKGNQKAAVRQHDSLWSLDSITRPLLSKPDSQ